ncbi:MAG: c-type cytochrome [Actinomycetota bacterium]
MRSFKPARSPLFALLLAAVPLVGLAAGNGIDKSLLERGRYLTVVAGCNDCHTPGYAASDGKMAERHWLVGDQLGYRGPWGTTYPSNLRRYFNNVSEAEWLRTARNASYRPPMPSPALRAMTDEDLRAIYHFVRSLGPAMSLVPAYVPPEQQPIGPVVLFPLPPT